MINKIKRLFTSFWAIPLVLFIRKLKPLCLVRFGIIDSSRIGNFTAQTILHWVEIQEQQINAVDLFWFSKDVSNMQWDKMASRTLRTHWSVFYLDYWNKKIPNGHDHILKSVNRDMHGKVKRTEKTPIEFLPEEELFAKNWLRKYGWKENEKFVCLLVRDSTYLKKTFSSQKINFDYHNYRDTSISDYVQATKWLIDKGVWVLRMGSVMSQPFPIDHPRVIDYSFCNDKNDLMDIWLFANCDLCISTGSGLDCLSEFYKKPMLFVNLLPICNIWSWCESLNLPKHLIWKSTGKPLTLGEHLIHNYSNSEDYENAGILVKDLSSQEILYATQECWEKMVEDTWVYTREEKKQQGYFWEELKKWPSYSKKHDWIHQKCQISYSWLKNNNYDFLI